MRRWFHTSLFLGIASAVVAFYFWTALIGQPRSQWPQEIQDYDLYNHLTDGFASGHLYIAYQPKPELLALKDPYDPAANAPWRLHDASLYRGHYYIYWGPVPVLTLYLPFYLITGTHVPENVGVAVFASVAYLATCLLFFALMKRLDIPAPPWMRALFVAVLGLCQFVPWMLRRAMVYECAILAGAAFVMLGFYFWLRGLESESAPWWMAAAGLSFGFAAGSRPHFALLAGACVVATAVYCARRESSWRALVGSKALAVAIPVTLCGLGLLWYNWARFGSVTEFGVTYQLSVNRIEGIRPAFGKFLAGLYYFLICPVRLRETFPFLQAQGDAIFGGWVPKGQFVEPIAGLFTTTPVYVLGFFLPAFSVWRRKARTSAVRMIVWAIWGAAMTVFLILCPLGWACLRYSVDFAPEFLVLSLLVAAALIARSRQRRRRWAAMAVLAGACAFGIVVNTLISFVGVTNGLERYEPATYDRIARAFAKMGIGKHCVAELDFEGSVRFPTNPPAGARITVLRTGAEWRTNLVALEFVSGDRFKVQYEQGGTSAVWTTPEREYLGGSRNSVQIGYRDAERRVRIAVNGAEVLSAHTFWYPTMVPESDPEVQIKVDRIERAASYISPPEGLPVAIPADNSLIRREAERLWSSRRYADAVVYLKRAVREHPSTSEAHYSLAFSLHLAGNLTAAIAEYNKALELGYVEFWVRYNRGNCYAALKKPALARQDLERATRLNPSHADARAALANLGH
jgi:hypothetical protein